ncbi:MAG: ribose 5-phosphate isomerase [Candidatus Hydrogenedentes bacterium]|nr:ribose 5-phosphate isomerase [Candidatus Hydrogenedentota bacterium]
MNIAVGSDHAGYEEPAPYYKPALIAHVEALGHRVVDCGTDGPDAVDYPDIAAKVSEAVLSGTADRGILLCGTGIGVGIAANRFKGIRAATCATAGMARLAREHNDANVLAIGRRVLTLDECRALIEVFLETPFSGAERHRRRVDKMG